MILADIIFWFFITIAGLSAIGILLSKNVFKAALMLLTCLLSVAALFVFSFAEFVAVTQILIYAGGVLVLIIFGIMLTSKLSGKPLEVKNGNLFSGGALCIGILLLLLNLLFDHPFDITTTPFQTGAELKPTPIRQTGIELMTNYSLPFELAGILLLVALIGAGVFTSFLKEKKW